MRPTVCTQCWLMAPARKGCVFLLSHNCILMYVNILICKWNNNIKDVKKCELPTGFSKSTHFLASKRKDGCAIRWIMITSGWNIFSKESDNYF